LIFKEARTHNYGKSEKFSNSSKYSEDLPEHAQNDMFSLFENVVREYTKDSTADGFG